MPAFVSRNVSIYWTNLEGKCISKTEKKLKIALISSSKPRMDLKHLSKCKYFCGYKEYCLTSGTFCLNAVTHHKQFCYPCRWHQAQTKTEHRPAADSPSRISFQGIIFINPFEILLNNDHTWTQHWASHSRLQIIKPYRHFLRPFAFTQANIHKAILSYFPEINWEHHRAGTIWSRRFLKNLEASFMEQALREQTWKGALLVSRVEISWAKRRLGLSWPRWPQSYQV